MFINRRLSPLAHKIETDYIATGFKNMIGNKGAVKIKFQLVDTTIVLINGHLHSGLEGVANRNNDVEMILNRFVYSRDKKDSTRVLPEVKLPNILMLLGDLNYRINGYKPSII